MKKHSTARRVLALGLNLTLAGVPALLWADEEPTELPALTVSAGAPPGPPPPPPRRGGGGGVWFNPPPRGGPLNGRAGGAPPRAHHRFHLGIDEIQADRLLAEFGRCR
ncbi:hypothetical protein I5F53_12935 [Pseudomonas aeruginosa]|nr:hypothetical protein [Pseudomonas aeruginosa]